MVSGHREEAKTGPTIRPLFWASNVARFVMTEGIIMYLICIPVLDHLITATMRYIIRDEVSH
jgi:hypothetical protein